MPAFTPRPALLAVASAAMVLGLSGLVACSSSDKDTSAAEAQAANAATPVNTMCPIGKEAITEAGGVVLVGSDTVAFCCEGCQVMFAELPAAKQAEYVNLAKQGRGGEFEI